MADEDFQERSEEATHKKLADSRKKGRVAKSQDLTAAGMILGLVLVLFWFGPWIFGRIQALTIATLQNLNHPFTEPRELSLWASQGLFWLAATLGPLFLGAVVLGVLMNALQVGFLVSEEPIKPKLKNINIFDVSNYKKFFSLQAIMKLVFGLGKIAVVGIVGYFMILYKAEEASRLMHGSARDILAFVTWESFLIGFVVGLILLILGIFEFTYQKWKFAQDMKMTKQEVKEERKQAEGDVQVKSRMRSMMQSFAQSRMKTNVPHADVIVANPVHYAIAIKYDPETMAAPLCLAKGARRMALAIREIAEEHEIPIVENPPLAQNLYRVVEVGQLIPPEFYQSVAEILAYVYRMNEAMAKR